MEAWASPSPLERLAHLVAQMHRGGERALEKLYDTTVGKLFALAKAILRHEKDAEEVVCATCGVWCRLRDSNPRPTVYKTVALPLC
jgi:DNA-directed RNA polymerase specialized sigma24 family protein